MISEKEQRLLRHCQTMGVLANCIGIELQQDLIDYRFKDPAMNNQVRKLKESLNQIKLGLAFKFKIKDPEHLDYEHSIQVHRLFKYFSTMDTVQLTELMDAYEEYDKIHPPVFYTDKMQESNILTQENTQSIK